MYVLSNSILSLFILSVYFKMQILFYFVIILGQKLYVYKTQPNDLHIRDVFCEVH